MGALVGANLVVLLLCLWLRGPMTTSFPEQKTQAVDKAMQAQLVLGNRLKGPEYTPITTTLAPRSAKELSRHPDFAAVFVEWLMRAGAAPGMHVAVNLSGSFPALNIAVLAAIQSIGAEPVITSSIGASTWGATDPELTWLDMEEKFLAAGVWKWRSSTVSIGGVGDRGGGLTPEGKALAMEAIARSAVKPLLPLNLNEAIQMRLEAYKAGNAGELPPILVNVGGNHVIFGEAGHRAPLPEGINFGYHPLLTSHDGLAAAFLRTNRPVIHVINIAQIAAKYDIDSTCAPGGSKVFRQSGLSYFWRALLACWLIASLYLLWRRRPAI